MNLFSMALGVAAHGLLTAPDYTPVRMGLSLKSACMIILYTSAPRACILIAFMPKFSQCSHKCSLAHGLNIMHMFIFTHIHMHISNHMDTSSHFYMCSHVCKCVYTLFYMQLHISTCICIQRHRGTTYVLTNIYTCI